MQFLKQSATATVTVGPVLDADGVAVTTAVLADFSISKNGTVAVLTGATVTHSTNGYYTVALTTGNVDTLGRLDLIVNNAAMSMSNHRYDVIVAQVYDSIVSGSDLLQVDVTQLNDSTQNADRILIGVNSNRTVQVTGSNHVAADVHEFQTDVIDSDAIAASAVTEIQAGLATSSGVIAAFTEIKGAGWSSSTDTLEKIRDASGGSNITISPLAANDIQRVEGTSITLFLGEAIAVGPVAVFDSSTPAAPVNLTSFQPLELVVSKKFGGDIVVIPNASITISGVNNNNFSVNSSGGTNIPGIHAWALRKVSTQQVLAYGDWKVLQAAIKDS
jgi:hypothetical protein